MHTTPSRYALILAAALGAVASFPAAAQSPGSIQSLTLNGATSDAATSLSVDVQGITGAYCNMEVRRADGRRQQFEVHASAPFPVTWKHDDISLETLRKYAMSQGMVAYRAIGVPTDTRPACSGRAEVVLVAPANSVTPKKK